MAAIIRAVRLEDAEGLVALLRNLTDELPRFAAEPLEATQARVSDALAVKAERTLLVAENKSQIAGFVHTHWQSSLLFDGGEGLVAALFIHSEYRGRGLGQTMMMRIQEEGKRRGCSRLILLNMRDRPSYERGFYSKLGWKERPDAANFVYNLRSPR